MTANLDPNAQPIATLADLNTAIESAESQAANSGVFEIDLAANTTIDLTSALEAINLKSGVILDIVGNGATLDGQGDERGLFVYAGQVTISDLTIANATAQGGGGGGLGAGGGLFVGANVAGDPGQVTLNNVTFSHDSAVGGDGGAAGQTTGGGGGGGGVGGQAGIAGGDGGAGGFGGGGGGLAAGGDIFVQSGASLTIGATSSDPSGSSVGAGVVTGGAGGGGNSFSGAGAAYGSGIFLDGMTSGGGDGVEKLTLGAGQIAGQTTTISGIIADEAGSVQGAAGQGELVIEGQGTVKLAPVDSKGAATANTFVGGILLEGGTLELASSGAAGAGALTFVNDAKLVIDGTAMPANLISGFAAGDVIDLTGVAFTDETATLDSSDALHFTENGQTYTLQFDAAAAGLSFSATSDGAAGTDITVACYGAGTRIRTGRGEVAVEDLRVGDMALTAGGGRRPIGWIGWRELDVTRHPDPRAVRPVRIAAGAFGDLKPRRDLWLSPGHNVFVDGVLIPAIVLANGATIEQVSVEKVVYYHVELDAHDIVLAESYLDCGNRDAFANGGGATELFPDFAPRADRATCCPICKTGPKVEAAKARLLARAQDFGFAATRDPDLHLLADGARIEPDRIEGRRYAFSLSGHVKDIRLASRVWTPSHMRSDSADDRDLGVLATRLAIDGAPRDLTALADGWREVESASWRWTDGFARLPAGARTIVIEIGDDPFYWTDRSDATALLFGFVAGARGLRAV